MCMLLMGCGSGGGFNPLSLNPTLLALPENSFSRTGGQFTAASSQYLSVASPTGIVNSSSDFLVCGWFKLDSTGTFRVLVASSQNLSGINWIIGTTNAVPAVPYVSILNSSNSVIAQALSPTTILTGTWYFFTAYHDSSAKQLGMSIDAGSFGTATYSGTPRDASYPINLGSYSDANYHDGAMDNILYMAGTDIADLASTIATALYNSGNGLAFQDITSAQETDWGIVSGWLDNSLTADAFGSNTLTNNNAVTQAAGKVNAVAVDNDPTYFVDGADLTQVTLANRPLYDVDAFGSGKHGWLGTNAGQNHFPWSKVLPTKYSISVWLKPNFNYNSAATTYNLWSPNTQQQFLRYEGRTAGGANDQFVFSLVAANYELVVPFFTFSSGDLIHLAVTIDRDTDDYRIYKDGSLADTYNSTPGTLTATTTIYIGSWTAAGNGWEGWMGPVLYTDDILTASEILSLYNHGPQ